MHYVGAITTNHPEILSPRLNGGSQDDEFKVHADDKNKPGGGFTLIELLVVIVIIGTLAALVTIMVGSARAKARDGKRVSDIKQIQSSLEAYYAAENSYPTTITFGQPLVGATSGQTMMNMLPRNPSPYADGSCPNADYSYKTVTNTVSYILDYCLGANSGQANAGYNAATPSSNSDVTMAGLVGYWPFNGGALDASGNNNNGTVTGATLTTNRSGTANSAYNFNGSNAYMNMGTKSVLGGMPALTISSWVYVNQLPPSGHYYVPISSSNIYRTMISNGGTLTFTVATVNNGWYAGAGNTVDTSSPITVGLWYYIVSTYDGSYLRIYVNGILGATSSPSISGNILSSAVFRLGYNDNYPTNLDYLNGFLDDVRIYNRALSAAEVAQLYASGN